MFVGVQPIAPVYPFGWTATLHNHILDGATDDIELADPDATTTAPFLLPFDAASDDPVLEILGSDRSNVHLREATGVAHLRIVDPSTGELYDRYAYAASPLASAAVIANAGQVTSVNAAMWAQGVALWKGSDTAGIAMLDASANRLIDSTMVVSLAGATQTAWDTLKLPSLAAGHYAIAVATSSGLARTVDLEIVDRVDSIAVIQVDDDLACFAATTNGAFVANVPWTFEIAGQVVQQDAFSHWMGQTCLINPTHAHPFTVTAHAGGLSATASD